MAYTFDWHQQLSEYSSLSIPLEWLSTRGRDVKVAFADAGVNLGLPSLKHLDKAGHKFHTGSKGFSVAKLTGLDEIQENFGAETLGHGTLYASLLAGKPPADMSTEVDSVTGIANEAIYYLIKATDKKNQDTRIKDILNAIELSANLGIEIFITGQCISRSEMEFEKVTDEDIKRVFNIPAVKQMLVFAPLKNFSLDLTWEKATSNYFPSHCPDVVNVANLPNLFEQKIINLESQNIPFLLSGFNGLFLSHYGKASRIKFSNSGATAIMGGISTLAISYFKQKNNGRMPSKSEFFQLIESCSYPFTKALENFEEPIIFKNSKTIIS